ncbi:MAG: right-handed parallel beta-helix repeat-containing protein [Methanobacteriota archaeon]
MDNNYKCYVISFFIITSTFLFSNYSVSSSELNGNTFLYVGGDGSGNYTKIQSAIDNANPGDTIFVFNGTYYEHVIIDKSISLIGENKYTTGIDGNEWGDVVLITANNVSLSGFIVKNGGAYQGGGPEEEEKYQNDACIEILSNNNQINEVICSKSNYGIWIRDSFNNIIKNASIYSVYDGIWIINSSNCTLRNNTINGNGIVLDGDDLYDFHHDIDTSNKVNDGKPVYYYWNKTGITIPTDAGQVILAFCSNCTVEHLDISDVTDGISLFYTITSTIQYNKIMRTTDFAIRLVHSDRNSIQNNELIENVFGIGFMSGGMWIYSYHGYSNENKIKNNIIKDSNIYGVFLDKSNSNIFAENRFIHNGYEYNQSSHVFFIDSYRNTYDKNYWDDYIGVTYKHLCFLPKIIKGYRHLCLINPNRISLWLSFDWNPQLS